MKFLLAICLLTVPLIQGAAVTDTEDGSAPTSTTTTLKSHRQFEREIHENYTKIVNLNSEAPWELNEDGEVDPVTVTINSYVRNVGPVEKVEDGLYYWSAEFAFRQKWNDKRLAYDATEHPDFKYVFLNTPARQKLIWKPDTFFSDAIHADFHFVTAPNSLIWVYPNGDVLYSLRLSLKFRCNDPQRPPPEEGKSNEAENLLECPVRIASWGYTADKLRLQWEKDDPIQLSKKLYIPTYTLKEVATERNDASTKIGSWSAIQALFKFSHN